MRVARKSNINGELMAGGSEFPLKYKVISYYHNLFSVANTSILNLFTPARRAGVYFTKIYEIMEADLSAATATVVLPANEE